MMGSLHMKRAVLSEKDTEKLMGIPKELFGDPVAKDAMDLFVGKMMPMIEKSMHSGDLRTPLRRFSISSEGAVFLLYHELSDLYMGVSYFVFHNGTVVRRARDLEWEYIPLYYNDVSE